VANLIIFISKKAAKKNPLKITKFSLLFFLSFFSPFFSFSEKEIAKLQKFNLYV